MKLTILLLGVLGVAATFAHVEPELGKEPGGL